MRSNRKRAVPRLGWWIGAALVFLLLALVVLGVSVPAGAAEEKPERRRQSQAREQRVLRQSRGERGHVRRRADRIDKRSRVEKKPGWRRVE